MSPWLGTFICQHEVEEVQQDQGRHKVSRHKAELVQVQLAPGRAATERLGRADWEVSFDSHDEKHAKKT